MYGPYATYRNLAKSFYDAGKPDLVETVCVVMIYPVNTSHVPISHTTAATQSRSSSCAWTFLLLSFVIIVSSVLLASYFEADNSQRGNHLASQSPSSVNPDTGSTGGTEVENICHGHKASVAPNNLPHLPGLFIGRDKDVESVTHLLRFTEHSHTKMVHIFGLPAVGKSTVAIHVGYEMASQGVAVRYINVDETHIVRSREHIVTENHDQRTSATTDLTKRVSDIQLSWYSHTEKRYVSTSPQGLIQWAKGLSNDTILIIDNCDTLLQSNATQKEFIDVLDDLITASRFLHIVTTGRLMVILLEGKLHSLKPLDNESAIELLQSVSNTMTLNDSRTVNELVGGIPLALKIVGSLVSEIRPPDLIIRDLKQNLIDTLTPKDFRPDKAKMRPVLQLSFDYLDTNTQECALYLSHFPGSFSHEAALHILGYCTNSSPVECLTNLTDRSLLDPYSYAGQPRYQFHKLIKEYLTDVEIHKSHDESSRIVIRFNSSFFNYYTQALSGFVSRYSEIPHDNENVGRFEYESHNFECLLEKVHCFHKWPVIPFVNLTRSLTCQLMLEMFTKMELLKVGQRSLMLLEDRMDDISAEIGGSETLNLYRDLVLQLRKWMQSHPRSCFALCEEIFLPNHSSRYHTIDKQLAMSNYNRFIYYDQVKFPYYKTFGESFCYSYCAQFPSIDISWSALIMSALWLLAILIFETVLEIKKLLVSKVVLAFITFCYYFSLFFDSLLLFIVFILVMAAMSMGGRYRSFPLPNTKSCCRCSFYRVLRSIPTGAFGASIAKDLMMIHFHFICIAIICIVKPLSPRVATSILMIFSLVFIVDAVVFEIDTLHYASSLVCAFLYPLPFFPNVLVPIIFIMHIFLSY